MILAYKLSGDIAREFRGITALLQMTATTLAGKRQARIII
jgi:hypothetical protein